MAASNATAAGARAKLSPRRGDIINKAFKSLAVVFIAAPLLGAAPRCDRGAAPAAKESAARVASTPAGKETKPLSGLPEGTWGGRGVVLRVTAQGASVEYDCAHGTIEGQIELDAKGRFDVNGTFVPEGGPVSVPADGSAAEKSFKARYRGQVEGKKLTLNVTVAEAGGEQDPITLTHGQEPNLVKCY
jgi:hypothetical protein